MNLFHRRIAPVVAAFRVAAACAIVGLAVMGLLPWTANVSADQITFDGRDLLKISKQERRAINGRDMAMIFQEPMTSLNPCFTVGFQVTEALRTHLQLDKSQARQRAITSRTCA